MRPPRRRLCVQPGTMAEQGFVATLDNVEEYLELQKQLQDLLHKGLFSLAQAKYSKGPLGQHCYDMDMQASSTVDVIEEEGSDSLYSEFRLRSEAQCQPVPSSSSSNCRGAASVTQGTQGAAAAGGGGDGAEGGRQQKKGHAKDPLNWFGILVPPTLKDTQRSFRQALEVCVQLANRSQRIKQGIEDVEVEDAA